jgi:hypothetical protein
VAKVRAADEPFPDRREQHEREIAQLRMTMAAVVKLVFTLVAVILALAAVLIAISRYVSTDNALVRLVLNLAGVFDGPFSKDDGVFAFTGKNAEKLDAVTNWGLAAIVYMVIGNVLRRLLRPGVLPGRR